LAWNPQIRVKPPINRRLSNILTLIAIGAVIVSLKTTLNSGAPSRSDAERSRYHLQILVWATTNDEVQKLAVKVCNQVSQTCATAAAHTNDMDDVFAVLCCTEPEVGCAAGVAKGREEALAAVKNTFARAGFAACMLKGYFNAGDGTRG
jgi:hypothetical protein